jgi:hypothetical protein
MADVIILEFDDVDPGIYDKVNGILGLDPNGGGGDWPEGMISHVGANNGNRLMVVEVWESQAAQEAFMAARLGPALGQGGAPQPSRIEWMTQRGYHTA